MLIDIGLTLVVFGFIVCNAGTGVPRFSLHGGRSSVDGVAYDGYIGATLNGLPGYVCREDDVKTNQENANLICQLLGFKIAYDVPTDNRYGTPKNTLQPYKIICDQDDKCTMRRMTEACSPTDVLSVWCVKDHSFRLVTDDVHKLLWRGFVAFYFNSTWWKMPARNKFYTRICQELGFERKYQHIFVDKNETLKKEIPAEVNYKFGEKEFICNEEVKNCSWQPPKTNKLYPDLVICTIGDAQTIINRIQKRIVPSTIVQPSSAHTITTTSTGNGIQGGQQGNGTDSKQITLPVLLTVAILVLVVVLVLLIVKIKRRNTEDDTNRPQDQESDTNSTSIPIANETTELNNDTDSD